MNADKLLDNPDLGKLILRLGAGLILFLHGLWKIGGGMAGTVEQVAANGFPGWLAYGTCMGEVLAPLLMMLGKFSRPAGLLVAFNMLMTVVVAHRDIAFQLNDFGGWMIELNVLIMLGGLAVAFLGAGRYSLSGGKGKWD
jgi:putative oxidoreductase